MTTLAMPSTLTTMFHSADPFTERQQALIEGTAQNIAHSAVLNLLERAVREERITRAALARKLGRDPSQITRWLSSPGNWTLQTLGLLMGAMGHLPAIGAQPVSEIWQYTPNTIAIGPPEIRNSTRRYQRSSHRE